MRRASSVLIAAIVAACGAEPAAAPLTTMGTTSTTAATTTTSPTTSTTTTVPEATGPPAEAAPFSDPDTLDVTLLAAEQAIRSPTTPPEDLERWAWAQQQAYRDLVAHPDWQEGARDAFPVDLQAAFDANLSAGEALRTLTSPQDELPDWRIVSPPPPDELLAHYRAAQEELGVGWEYLAAIHLIETRMGRIRGDSIAGARGPMQFLPSTWEAFGKGDIEDPGDAIRAAARYLVAHGAPDDMDRALWAYNHSDLYVEAVKAHAQVMRDDPRAYFGYYHWQVYYRLASGDVVLEEGWEP